jgi:hypothetical protein
MNRGMPGGWEEFIFKKSFDLSLKKSPKMQEVRGRSKSSKEVEAQEGERQLSSDQL